MTRPWRTAALGLLGCMAAITCAAAREPGRARVTVFDGVTVLPMEGQAAAGGRSVVVEDGRITWLGPAEDVDAPADALRIDGSGKWLIPGLADMHVHMESGDVPLFLANGVTTVREMNGSPEHLALRDSIARGERIGPHMLVASTLLAGESQRWRHEWIQSADQAYAAAHRAADAGYDYLKVYSGLSAEAYSALAEASRTLGLPLTGHIPAAVGLEGVVEAGQGTVEHTEQLLYALSANAPDPDGFGAAAERLAAAGTWVTPTLAVQEALTSRRTLDYARRLERPEMRFVDPGLMEWWRSLAPRDTANIEPEGDERRRRARAFYEANRALTAALARAGVPLLVGTDTPNPLMVPGFSIHLELAALIDAGIAPLDALRAATAGAAGYAGDRSRGTIRVGAIADLLLLDADPLVNLETLQRPVGVMVGGVWLDRARLDQLVEERRSG